MNHFPSKTNFVRISLFCLLIKSFSFCCQKKKLGIFAMSLFTSRHREDKITRKTTALHDTFQSETLCKMAFFEEVSSTMDKAKEIQTELSSYDVYAVVTKQQTAGRGTRGRNWQSSVGNVMMTVSFKVSAITIPLTLIPLRIGTILAPIIQRQIGAEHKVYLKWPNDVLIEDKKVCGVLIEMDGERVYVGIGCNIESIPDEESIRLSGGRIPTCTSNFINKQNQTNFENIIEVQGEVMKGDDEKESKILYLKIAEEIGLSIGRWIRDFDNAQQVLKDFEERMDFNRTLQLRTEASATTGISSKPVDVVPLYLNEDGTLQIREVDTGVERTLIAEYLY